MTAPHTCDTNSAPQNASAPDTACVEPIYQARLKGNTAWLDCDADVYEEFSSRTNYETRELFATPAGASASERAREPAKIAAPATIDAVSRAEEVMSEMPARAASRVRHALRMLMDELGIARSTLVALELAERNELLEVAAKLCEQLSCAPGLEPEIQDRMLRAAAKGIRALKTVEHARLWHIVPEWLTRDTFALQYNTNCPSPFLVRLIGQGKGALDLQPYAGEGRTGDALGFGATIEEAAQRAFEARKGQRPATRIGDGQ